MNIGTEHQIDFVKDFESQMGEYFKKSEFPESSDLISRICGLVARLDCFELDVKVDAINRVREAIHGISPFKAEPVDFVRWVKNNVVTHNDYNPNKVAPPEMQLLELSIMNDGYTQPIVSWSNQEKGMIEVIDGFHRHRVGKESKVVNQRVQGYLPVVDIRTEQSGKQDRIASTIRHNRARGKHQVDAMSEIVIELKNRNWANARIAKELGMDEEEVLRLCQISGLEELFSDKDFSRAWVSADDSIDWEDLTDEIDSDVVMEARIPNEGKGDRVFHTYDKWECHKAGLYASNVEGKTAEQCKIMYKDFLSDTELFAKTLELVVSEWVNSCEHYLTNFAMNRIAWLGQAAMCYHTGVPSKFCGGFNLLTFEEQGAANQVALKYLNVWLESNGRDKVNMDEALSAGRQVEIY